MMGTQWIPHRPQVKICGLTRIDEAQACVECGADAIGLVFYSKSPRNVSLDQARDISIHLPKQTARIGVFVNESFSHIMKTVQFCMLTTVQLHGQEPPEMVSRICNEGIDVVKALFTHNEPSTVTAGSYPASAFLVECGKGQLPGGNARKWNWESVNSFGLSYPLILAGGLQPDSVVQAVSEANPDAVDVSSGVESSPGRKDIHKVTAFIESLSCCFMNRSPRKIWN